MPKQRHHTYIETIYIRRPREARFIVRGLFTAPVVLSGGCSLTRLGNRNAPSRLYHARALRSRAGLTLAWDVAPLSCDTAYGI